MCYIHLAKLSRHRSVLPSNLGQYLKKVGQFIRVLEVLVRYAAYAPEPPPCRTVQGLRSPLPRFSEEPPIFYVLAGVVVQDISFFVNFPVHSDAITQVEPAECQLLCVITSEQKHALQYRELAQG